MSVPDLPDDNEGPGWQAIDEALDALYHAPPPHHYGTSIDSMLGGLEALDGLSVYPRVDPDPHWHFVTYGFSDLYEKTQGDDPGVSGYGFELTFRLARSLDDAEPPPWVWNFLQNLAQYVFDFDTPFGVGHRFDCHGPIRRDADTLIHAITFRRDPELPETVATPNGDLEFLQVIGITPGELLAIQAWNGLAFVDLLARDNPLLVTDLSRPCQMDDAEFAAAVQAGAARDGASSGSAYVSKVRYALGEAGSLTVTIDALAARTLARVLPGRLPHGRRYALNAEDAIVEFVPADATDFELDDKQATVELHLAPPDAQRVAAIAGGGSYRLGSKITLVVEPADTLDGKGNVVGRVE